MPDAVQSTRPSPKPVMIKREDAAPAGAASKQIAHTLTACCRCRARKTRCDPLLPRCGPCERTNSHCEYFDQAKQTKIPRSYVVHLQHKVRELEKKLEELEKDDLDPEPEDMVSHGARVQIEETDESKFLGPSSGIAITRLVMQLAKQFTDSASITQIVDQQQAENIKKHNVKEEEAKTYPLISEHPAPTLPQRSVTDMLLNLFNLKVMAMYPFFHEPTLAQDIEDVYNGTQDPFKNFAVRMVIAVSLQRLTSEYAGLADSYYLASLKYMEGAIKPMNVQTIQCFMLIGAYSLLTPTRTAVYYVIGLAVRLAQALGLCEEKTISQPLNGKAPNAIELDMRRRVFWSVINMDYGLAHSLGRSSCFAMSQEHIDVKWYECADDHFITPEGVKPKAPQSLKKWISIHFHKMRLHQLEIRRKLYQKKRDTPKDENDPWFIEMENKIQEWKDASPEDTIGTGLDKAWFLGRYNTMIAMLFRPTPQIPRPTFRAAQRCYDAVVHNIYMHREQIKTRSVEMTWIFTQAIFMTINTILWSLSYYEVRVEHPRAEVQGHLDVALECTSQAIERWPGVASAIELYGNLIRACMNIYDKDGDVPIAAGSPRETGPEDRSQTTSPVFQTISPVPAIQQVEPTPVSDDIAPFGYFHKQPSFHSSSPMQNPSPSSHMGSISMASDHHSSIGGMSHRPSTASYGNAPAFSFDENFNAVQYNQPLPTTFADFNWNPTFDLSTGATTAPIPAFSPYDQPHPSMQMNSMTFGPQAPVQYSDYLYPPSWDMDRSATGLNQQQYSELMHNLETQGTGQIQHMINATSRFFYPNGRGY